MEGQVAIYPISGWMQVGEEKLDTALTALRYLGNLVSIAGDYQLRGARTHSYPLFFLHLHFLASEYIICVTYSFSKEEWEENQWARGWVAAPHLNM